MSTVLRPDLVWNALAGMLREEIACDLQGNVLRVDAPYILQDGSLQQAVMEYGRARSTGADYVIVTFQVGRP